MIKKLSVTLVVLLAIQGYAQETTSSPYSFYGVGNMTFKGTAENRSMGGLSIYTDSIHVNLQNPAFYGGKNLKLWQGKSRPVTFTVGGSHSNINLKTAQNSGVTSATSFDYLAMAIPIGKLGFGFGILPYTSVGYKLETLTENASLKNRFTGDGGINRAFLGVGYQILEGLSIGAEIHYNFGNINNNNTAFLYDDTGAPLQYHSQEESHSNLSGLGWNFGLSYKAMVGKKLELVSGLTFSPKNLLVSKNDRTLSSIIVRQSGTQITRSRVEENLDAIGLSRTELTLPTKISIGTGLGVPRHWFVGVDYTHQKMSAFENLFYSNSNTAYEDASKFAVGGFFIPNYNSLKSYFNRVVYRAGMHFETTGLRIENESIKEFGISFGVGLPVGGLRSLSNANVGVELGTRGTTNNNLIQERFINFQISLSLNDRWFVKRKYN